MTVPYSISTLFNFAYPLLHSNCVRNSYLPIILTPWWAWPWPVCCSPKLVVWPSARWCSHWCCSNQEVFVMGAVWWQHMVSNAGVNPCHPHSSVTVDYQYQAHHHHHVNTLQRNREPKVSSGVIILWNVRLLRVLIARDVSISEPAGMTLLPRRDCNNVIIQLFRWERETLELWLRSQQRLIITSDLR